MRGAKQVYKIPKQIVHVFRLVQSKVGKVDLDRYACGFKV